MNYFNTCLNYKIVIRLPPNTWVYCRDEAKREHKRYPVLCLQQAAVPCLVKFLLLSLPQGQGRQTFPAGHFSQQAEDQYPITSGPGPTVNHYELKSFSNWSPIMLTVHSSSWSVEAARSYGHLEASLKAKPRGAWQLRHLPVEPGPLLSTTVRSASST